MRYAGNLYGLKVYENDYRSLLKTYEPLDASSEISQRLRFYAYGEFRKHNLSGWTLQFASNQDLNFSYRELTSEGSSVWGSCNYRPRTISLNIDSIRSAPCFELWKGVILHEIAHALVGYNAGHGLRWRLTCARLGGYPSEFANNTPLYMKVFSSGVYVSPNDYIIDTCQHGKFELLIAALLGTMLKESLITKVFLTRWYFRRTPHTCQNTRSYRMVELVRQMIGKKESPKKFI